ncbi:MULTISPECIES: Flp pilus assembly protein CpaB [unclassified Pseudodesulfovibrio]|uniref:Flp pilus assembly protein CpaB n=1 Tax=unclassified Pseudodesulfovibrio TaxID=2661612 RepID=UPI000FEBCB4F|nr:MULTISPECIES: Flp pilus assembly protein CpaB [unclassified Pseudodesulfovibrio]MCJ2164424.1 Flp pilus assembly protein CpaB [Pseudodesulfovibrio sp. S3-i]RWU04630.1 Flp pilus assembly protein CpaB [Pseudodesulfovibrio sp. S3]
MSKSTRALVQISLSLILAMVAGVLIFMWVSNMKQAAPVAAVESTVPVMVAKSDLKRGVKLTEEMIEVRKFTTDSRPSGAFSDPEKLAGRVLNQDVSANEAVTANKLADESVIGGGVSALIEPGKRAMAVKGNAVMGLSGFVRPGDRVDVIVSMTKGSNEEPVTKLVLEQIKVIATGTQLAPPDEDGEAASVDVYTLELTPEESERLALAATRGTLHFALRNEQDKENILTTGSSVPKTLAALRPKAKVRPNRASKVEVITGGNSFSVKF